MNMKAMLTAAVVAGFGMATAGFAQTEVKFGHVGEPGSLMDLSATEFAERANEKLGDSAKVVVYGSSQLGNDKAMLQKIKLGTVDLALPSTIMSSMVPIFGLFEMPYLVQDREHMKKIRDEIVMPEMAPQAEAAGFRIIGVWENGFRQITNNARPINTPEDLAGIKLRVPNGEWRVKMFETYGASPSPMAFSEVFVALQTGVMDGQENPYAQIYPSRFYEVQSYLSQSNHVYTPGYVVAGRSWDKFDPEVQQVLQETAVEMQDVVYEIAAGLDTDLLQKLKDEGMEVNEVDTAAFIEASQPIYAQFSEAVDGAADLIAQAQSLAPAE
ncbi:TRAP transporter substrate-binding protein [Paracoccus sediminicola]|uniref:TRAP transporter substrate-binding protein n=1 Tax=Paracoccus sediminicola TaxID=3017783 RepID=UPI0022F01B9D|nr:TRAP transporter substrate-binding protein [Paracoccus sediminicola]WBU57400.1 TRAP transporter substrate-binding protein [Paracoccus sediminicola]